MAKSRIAQLGLALAALSFTAATPLLGMSSAYAAEAVRPEVGKPLLEAQSLIKAGRNKEALSKLREAEAAAGRNANEQYLIDRVRASAAMGAGEYELAAKTFESLIASGKLSSKEKESFSDGLIGIYMRAKDYNKANAAILRQLREHYDPKLQAYLLQNYYNQGNTSAVLDAVRNEERAGHVPSEDMYGMVANLQNKSGDKAGYVLTIEKLAMHYPKARYWEDLLNRVQGKPNFSSRLAVDVYRLKLMNNLMKKPSEFMEMAQLVLQAKAPAEAQKVVAAGYKAGALGVGAEAARHQRLKDLADKDAAAQVKGAAAQEAEFLKQKDYDGLAAVGYGLVQAGQGAKGIALMETALKSGELKYPEQTQLHLGEAYAAAGQKAKAISALKAVGGKDGSADLARYFIMALNHPAS
jgi:hypothetical protein